MPSHSPAEYVMVFLNRIIPGLITLDCVPLSATSNIDILEMSSLSPDLSQTEMIYVVWCAVGYVNALRQTLDVYLRLPSEDI